MRFDGGRIGERHFALDSTPRRREEHEVKIDLRVRRAFVAKVVE
jgi:hypothetical protein